MLLFFLSYLEFEFMTKNNFETPLYYDFTRHSSLLIITFKHKKIKLYALE